MMEKDDWGIPYTEFARLYDEFMDNVDYPAWGSVLTGILRQAGIRDGLVLDLGCGTGTMTELLAQAGYDMTGVDASMEMLMQASEKKEASGHDILYLCQPMEAFELYGTMRAVISVCDCLNYILEEAVLQKVFSLVHNYLDPGGVFIFDMNTPYKYSEILGDTTIAENRDDASFIWENCFDEETGLNEYLLTLFIRRPDGLYEKAEELHTQRAYRLDQIRTLLEREGLKVVHIFDGYTDRPAGPESERWLFVCEKEA